jgi:hypothetical protein
MRRRSLAVATVAALALAVAPSALGASTARWQRSTKATMALDLVGPRADRRLVAAVGSHLWTLDPGGALHRFARGPDGYEATPGEPYIALSARAEVRGAGCSFARDDAYALDTSSPGIVRVSRRGRAVRLADGSRRARGRTRRRAADVRPPRRRADRAGRGDRGGLRDLPGRRCRGDLAPGAAHRR